MIKRTGVETVWHPFASIEGDLPERKADETVGQSHRRVRAEQRRATHAKYAALQDIDLRFPAPRGQTDLALGALATLEGDPLPYIIAAFEAYWTAQSNLDDLSIVHDLLSSNGYRSDMSGDTLRAGFTAAQDKAETLGIVDAPAYIIADQLFIGREHFPWIEEIIAGQSAS